MVSSALSSTTSTSLSACQEECTQASGCLAVVYNRYGECHLKSASGRVEQDNPEHHTISCKRTMDVGAVYGDLLRPAASGSGGGSGKYGSKLTLGGAGGGIINLTLTGELSLGSGASIAANGSPGNAGTPQSGRGGTTQPLSGGGGGFGGSVLVVSASVSGSGRIEATGGNGGARARHYHVDRYDSYYHVNRYGSGGGCGGGGRIAVHASSELSGEITMKATGGAPGQSGGASAEVGAPGTVYSSVAGGSRSLVLDNRPRASSATSASLVRVPSVEKLPAVYACMNTCSSASNGFCDDGGPGAEYSLCASDTDCADCMARQAQAAAPVLELETLQVYAGTVPQSVNPYPAPLPLPLYPTPITLPLPLPWFDAAGLLSLGRDPLRTVDWLHSGARQPP